MGLSYDIVSGRGVIIYRKENEKLKLLIKHIDPNYVIDGDEENNIEDLDICLEDSNLEKHLEVNKIGNYTTSRDEGYFIKILSELGEDLLISFGEQIIEVYEVCIN